MKRLFLFSALCASLCLVMAQPAEARIITSETNAIVGPEVVIDDDLYITGQTVTVEGIVNGDVYAAGSNVTVRGTVNGDVLAAGGMIDVSGTVTDDVRLAGGTITITGATIGDSLSVAGGNVIIDEQSTIGGGLLFGAGSITVSTDVMRSVVGGGGSVTLNGTMNKDVYVGTEQLQLGSNSAIMGDLVYGSEKELNSALTASVAGQVRRYEPPEQVRAARTYDKEAARQAVRGLQYGMLLWKFLSALLVGSLVLYFFSKPTQAIVAGLEKNWLSTLGWGFIVTVAFLPAMVLLAITGIGLPLALLITLAFAIEVYLSKIVVSVLIGKKLETVLNQKLNPYVSLALGLGLFYIVGALPFIGFFVKLATLFLGLGAIVSYKKEKLLKK